MKASKNLPKEISQSQLIQAVSDANKNGSCVKYGFILGAGASVTSNIPTGDFFAKKWFKEIKAAIGDDALDIWKASIEGFDETNLAASYTKLFDKRFEVNYTLGYQELQRYMDEAKPSIGYSFLAQVLAQTANKFVITTNFDTMSEDALFDLKEAKPLVLGHELLSGFINANSPTRPTIVKVHRDFLFDPYNSDSQIEEMDTQWQEALAPVLKENSIIVIGYGGNDESLMGYLEKIKSRKPIYWCYRNKKGLSKRIKQLLNKSDFLIKIENFDKFMLLLSDQLNFKSLIDREDIHKSEIVQSALARAKLYVTQLEKLAREDLGEEEQEAIKKLLPSWWDYELAVQQETDSDKQDSIYCEGLKAYPESYALMGNYASFLRVIRKEYDKAGKFYLKSLALKPEEASLNSNYALFLSEICKEYDEAEVFYLKALELEPETASFNGNYALFLSSIRKEYKAEGFYLKALELEPKNADFNGKYALFLSDIRKEYDKAEAFYLKALELEPENANLNSNYAFLLSDIRKEYDKAEAFYLKALALESENAGFNGNYASFLCDIREEYDKAEVFYLKALKLEPEKAAFNGNYALFLRVIRKEYDKAEVFYLKALELEPEEAIFNSNYALFLRVIREEYDKAGIFYLKSLDLDPENANVNASYACFLSDIRKEYDKAEEFYLKALKLEPENAEFNARYADFLRIIRKEYDKAESFYLKSLELEPEGAGFSGNYALLLSNIRKEYDKAEIFYLKSLELEPEETIFNGNYAQFLLVIGQKTKAASYLDMAFKYMTEENDLALELWFYRLAHFPEFYEQAKENLDRLLADGHQSIGWNFEGNIQQAEKEGFQNIALLRQYAKKITEE